MRTASLFGFLMAVAIFSAPVLAQEADDLIGSWDVTVTDGETTYPSWFEVSKSGYKTLVGRYVGQFGSARPISEVVATDDGFRFQVPPQWEQRTNPVVYEGEWSGQSLVGTTTNDKGEVIRWKATRAPDLLPEKPADFSDPISLFNGKDLSGWEPRFPERPNGWEVIDGILTNKNPGNDLVTVEEFKDYRLRVRFRYPEGSNSGIYLRGRYEVQVEDNYGKPTDSHHIGGVYGFLTPSFNAAKKPGEWQEYEITLVGRRVSVELNGTRVIDNQLIPGITGGALDSHEGQPGPLMIQGDHGPVEFQSIEIMPAK